MDDEPIERGWRILRKPAALPKNDPEGETQDQQCDVGHGAISSSGCEQDTKKRARR
jgi:hypothetical protein